MTINDQTVSSNVCLVRTEPNGRDGLTKDVIRVEEFIAPNVKITITEGKNGHCVQGDSCFVSVDDVLTLSVNQKTLTWSKVSGDKINFTMERIKVGPDLTILKANRASDPSLKWDVYLIYNGTGICVNHEGETCKTYRFEIHPDGLDAYPKPDEAEAKPRIYWNLDCSAMTAQPGGGDGDDEPV